MTQRSYGRDRDGLRPIDIQVGFTKWAEGSVLCSFGDTRVLCNASVEDRVSGWIKEKPKSHGWVTAEYSMLPRSTDRRMRRESITGKIGGRTHEISRLIGRALRAAVDLEALGERTITLDCDVLQADGGTRTAAITGAWVATRIAIDKIVKSKGLRRHPMKTHVAAVSLGVVGGEVLLDLDFVEDQGADTDLNLVMTGDGGIVEVQGTAEGVVLERSQLDSMLDLGARGIADLIKAQAAAIESAA